MERQMRLVLFSAVLALISCSSERGDVDLAPGSSTATFGSPAVKDVLYFDVSAFKDTTETITVDPPYDTIQDLSNVPEGKIKFTKEVRIDSSMAKTLSDVLQKAQEPVLNNSTIKGKLYRFTWLRSFDPTIILKLYEESGKAILETKLLESDGKVKEVLVKQLPEEKLAEFEQVLKGSDFWGKPSVVSHGLTIDGSCWLLEARQDDRYHFVNRYTPTRQKRTARDQERR